MTHELPDRAHIPASPSGATKAGSPRVGVPVTTSAEVQVGRQILLGAPVLTAGVVPVTRAPGLPIPPPTPPAPPAVEPIGPPPSAAPVATPPAAPAAKPGLVKPINAQPPKAPKPPKRPKRRKVRQPIDIPVGGCLVPLLLLVLAFLALVGLAKMLGPGTSGGGPSARAGAGAATSGTTSTSSAAATTSTRVPVPSTRPDDPKPRQGRGPIGLAPPFGTVPRTEPVAIELIIEPSLRNAETDESSFNDELAAATDYIETYSLPTDKVGVPGSGTLEPLRGKGARFIAQANGVGAEPLVPDAAMADAVAQLQPVADHRRAVIVIGSQAFTNQFRAPSDTRIAFRTIAVDPKVATSSGPAHAHTALRVRGGIAQAVARGFVETAGAGWQEAAN